MITSCFVDGMQYAQGSIFVQGMRSQVEMQSSIVAKCGADEGGAFYLGPAAIAVLEDVIVRETTAARGAAVFMTQGSQLQATHVIVSHECNGSTPSSVLHITGAQTTQRMLPIRGFKINSTNCDSSAVLIEGRSSPIRTPQCSDDVFADVTRRGDALPSGSRPREDCAQ